MDKEIPQGLARPPPREGSQPGPPDITLDSSLGLLPSGYSLLSLMFLT